MDRLKSNKTQILSPRLGFQDFFQKHVAGKIVDPAK